MAEDERTGRLGRLFAALVNVGDDRADEAAPAGTGLVEPDAEKDPAGGNTTVLDLEGLSRSLASSPDPMALLAGLVVDVRARVGATGAPEFPGEAPKLPPSPLEVHLATRLVEAGLLEPDVELPGVRVVRPRTSGLFYLRIEEERVSYLAKLRVLQIESALNAVLLASHALESPNDAPLDAIVRAEQRVTRSVAGQAREVASRLEGPVRGEWDVRYALAYGIEAFRLPHRLTARFRVNARAGLAAFELDLVPPEAWPRSAFVDGLGVVPATEQMRRRAAGTYNARLAALVAGYALAVAPELGEVWVAGVIDTARDHACLYSARIAREALEAVDLEGSFDPVALLRSCGAAISLDETGGLAPVRQGFSLDDEALCPRERYDAPELSEATLAGELGDALGCWRVSDLGIDEGARRRSVADELARHLTDSTEKNVRAILAAAREDGHPDVVEAARRCVSGLIDGELEDDPLAIGESFVEGGDLQRGCAQARDALLSHDLETAGKYAADALLPIDGLGSFDGSDGLVWRGFGSYADRALYNRLVAAPGERCALVPAAYLEAHTIAAASSLARGRAEEALAHARRAAEVAPLSSQASLNLAQCLEASGDPEAAGRELCRLLSLAHDPESIGLGYLGMAQLQWQGGHVLTAQACYQRATRHLGAPALVARLAMAALIGQVGVSAGGELSPDQADSLLEAAGIPLAPTEPVSTAFLEATRAATDAGIFRVARDLLRKLCMISRDDVYFGMLRSLEDEPDR